MCKFEIIENPQVAVEKAIEILLDCCDYIKDVPLSQTYILEEAFTEYMKYNSLTYEDIENLILNDTSKTIDEYGNNRGWNKIYLALNEIFDCY